MNTSFQACLGVHRLRLPVALGYGRGERSKPQPVEIEMRIFFKELPKSCVDEGEPFLCYDKLSSALQDTVAHREFRLIEYMANELFAEVRKNIVNQMGEEESKKMHVWLRLHKCIPPVPFMLGGASVVLSDLPGGITAADVA